MVAPASGSGWVAITGLATVWWRMPGGANLAPVSDLFSDICARESTRVQAAVLEEVLLLAVEIAREGREGRKIGTMFIVGDADAVIERSRCLILDPLRGHPEDARRVSDPNFRETLKELAQLDGAFIVREDGVVLSAARYIDVSAKDVKVPLGLGSRHLAGASITLSTKAVAVVVSESSLVRVFADGSMVSEVIPELWMLRSHIPQLLTGKVSRKSSDEMTVVTRKD